LNSFQNLLLLQNLYRLKSSGFEYVDPIIVNHRNDDALPSLMKPLHKMISQCYLCDLSKSRRQPMAGYGNPAADVMFIDAYVSLAEDESGSYYAGRSGKSLSDMIENVLELSREDVYITHAVKCKPLGSQLPSASEWNSCKSYLFKQIELIQPMIVIPLGPDAYRLLTDDESSFDQVRGEKIRFGEYTIVPIYHPQFLLRNPSLRRNTFNDLKTIKSCL
jgi:uracil-DNA glycosylase family 4